MGTQERRVREKQRRAEEILNAAEHIFIQKGYDTATVDDVAARVELSKGTVYLYFKNKEDLYLAVVTRALEVLNQEFADAAKVEDRGIDKVLAMAYAYLRFAQQRPDYFRMLAFLRRPEGIDLTEGQNGEKCKEVVQRLHNLLIRAVQTGIGDKSIDPALNPIKTALLLDAQLYAVVQMTQQNVQLVETGHEAVARALFHSFVEMLTKYLAPPVVLTLAADADAPPKPKTERPVRVEKPKPEKPEKAPEPTASLFEQPSLF